jgi:hypothetical protein
MYHYFICLLTTLLDLPEMSVMLTAPAVASVTVSFFASNVNFNISSVTFSGMKKNNYKRMKMIIYLCHVGNQTTFAIAIDPFALGYDTFSFLITGSDADHYEAIADVSSLSPPYQPLCSPV